MDIRDIIDLYQQRKEEKQKKVEDFYSGNGQPFMVMQCPPGNVWGVCNSLDIIYANNIQYFADSLKLEWTDHLPYLEPWIGTGVYANAFGCEYMFREDNAPHTHYKYHTIEELRGVRYPDWHKSPIMNMVLDSIDYMKDRTLGKLPLSMTDTQSPFDTATLVLDASEFFVACMIEREMVMDFMGKITDLIIEFSNAQVERIGEALVARPGHIMPSLTTLGGISISDDNLAVSSPDVNQEVALPFDQKIADAFGGLAIHSCGSWAHSMAKLKNLSGITMIDCALTKLDDPTPNAAADVRDALRGSGIIAKVRIADMSQLDTILEELIVPDLRVVVQIAYDENHAEENYKHVCEKLENLYATAAATPAAADSYVNA